MTPDRDESAPQGQTLAQPNSIGRGTGTGTGEPPTGEMGKGAQQPLPSTPRSRTSTSESKPKVHLMGTEGLVWDIQDVRKLRQDHRIAGSLAGSLPRSTMQNIFQGLPLRLLPEEISILLHHDVIELVVDNHGLQRYDGSDPDASNTTISGLTDHALVFEHLWKDQQFFIAPGMKFGGDYLLYRTDPLVCHASLVASVKAPDEPLSLVDVANSARLVSTVQKQHLLCSVLPAHANTTMTPTTVATTIPPLSESNRRVVAFAVEWAGF
ncbi:hypothetical protein K457DRAFT_91973 [Linnemannia elongata AG-77]|uniref:tRNA-intron lyase n=1 Tax=Linnemannia elongata AG-77 TaxID=1314771 RepID=A0A197K218_9FUNG|nr:hypothetical protein K457DRAFT_91973 [Linnemannia elongata AG-77]